jgi:hypothetical protein
MSEETQIEAVVPAPETENTADTESVVNDAPGEAEAPRVFNQEEVNKVVSERLAKERRKWERDQAARAAEENRPSPTKPPDPSKFTDAVAYAEALAIHRAEEILDQREARKREIATNSSWSEREEAAREKYDDFERVALSHPANGGPTISNEMAAVIKESEIGPEIAYYLGKNTAESRRIATLSPLSQAREIGKIEASLTANPPAKKTSSAPEPIKTVGTRSSTPKYDTTDPRSIKTMSDSEWIEAERKRQMQKLRAQQS